MRKQSSFEGIPENEIIECAIQSLGLNDLDSFSSHKKIIEYAISEEKTKLVDLASRDLLNEVSSKTPAPGGGSISAL